METTIENTSNEVINNYKKVADDYKKRGWDKRNAVLDVFYSMVKVGKTRESQRFFNQVKATVLKKTNTFQGAVQKDVSYRNHPLGL
jgi:hypothetical protein